MQSRTIYIRGCLVASLLSVCLAGCRKDSDIPSSRPKPEKPLAKEGPITHLYADTVYINSASPVFTVESGEQLLIDEGTVIKGIYFNVEPGGVIIANGTRENPIIFTSRLNAGNQAADAQSRLVIRGKSRNNSRTNPYDSLDFSGTLKYVRIEFGSLALESVGSRTLIENVMVSYSGIYSSFEIIGGTFNAKNLISYACGGPADFYITEGYTGKMQHVIALRHPFFGNTGARPSGALAGVFIENNPNPGRSAARPFTNPFISNLTAMGPDMQDGSPALYTDTTLYFQSGAMVTTSNTRFQIRNSLLAGHPGGGWHLDDSLTADRVLYRVCEMRNTVVHANYWDRVFYLLPGGFPPYTSENFRNFMMDPFFVFRNLIVGSTDTLMLKDPFNYEKPDLSPKNGSFLLQGADFEGPDFGSSFFDRVPHRGALGSDNWLQGWTNFTPLKTNYNFQR